MNRDPTADELVGAIAIYKGITESEASSIVENYAKKKHYDNIKDAGEAFIVENGLDIPFRLIPDVYKKRHKLSVREIEELTSRDNGYMSFAEAARMISKIFSEPEAKARNMVKKYVYSELDFINPAK